MNKFKELGLSQETVDILEKKGYTEPTEIQAKAIPMLLNGTKDIVGQSQTGTGKTASFALPILEKLKPKGHVSTLVLAPTRELAMQVKNEIDSLKGDKKISTLTVYGGAPIGNQIAALKDGVDIVVGTPGRIIDLINRKVLKLQFVDYVVLDEADEMLNMGFVEDIEEILKSVKPERQMLLFSATMPKSILRIAEKFMGNYETINVKSEEVTVLTEQIYYDVVSTDRIELLRRVIDTTNDFYGIIFCETKLRVDDVTEKLTHMDYKVAALHGDISQGGREQILAQFKKKKINILVATDVAARGIDVNDLTHVVNYSFPQSLETYVHRIGRTGRAGKKGIAITFVIPSEKRKLKFIENIIKQKLIKKEIPDLKDVYKLKEKKTMDIINNIIEKSKSSARFEDVADKLMESYDQKKIIVALLQYGFKSQISMDGYKDLKDISSESSKGGRRDRNNRSPSRERRDSNRGNRPYNRDSERSSSERRDRPRPFEKRDGPRNDGGPGQRSSDRKPFVKRDRPATDGRGSDRKPFVKRDGLASGGRSSDRKPFVKRDGSASGGRSSDRRSSGGRDRTSSSRSPNGRPFGGRDRPTSSARNSDKKPSVRKDFKKSS